MYDDAVRERALVLHAQGATVSEVARVLGISRGALRDWRRRPEALVPNGCARCHGACPRHGASYSALLGFYLGDGCVSVFRRTRVTLRVACDATYPRIVDDVSALISDMAPRGDVFHVRAPGVVVVTAMWRHWLCLFPQHGPGRKHDRMIELEPWQSEIVDTFPADFLRGLFHSDGARVKNWATRIVNGERKRYAYPRWQFSNRSEDILGLCGDALTRADVQWRRSSRQHISVSRRDAVARLDELIGLKA